MNEILLAFFGILTFLGFILICFRFRSPKSEVHTYQEALIDNEIQIAELFTAPFEKPPSNATTNKFIETEKRLNCKIPQTMQELYKIQNGGYIHNTLCLNHGNEYQIFLQEPLLPLEKLKTGFEHFQIYGEPDDADYAYMFIPEAHKIIILLADHQDILFLDYNSNNQPRVGLANHSISNWYSESVWWTDFENFLKKLRRYRILETQ